MFRKLGAVLLALGLVLVSITLTAPTSGAAAPRAHILRQGATSAPTVSITIVAAPDRDGTYIAQNDQGGRAAATVPFTLLQSVTGDQGTDSVTETTGPSKLAVSAVATPAGVDAFELQAARTAVAAGQSVAGATAAWGPRIGKMVAALRAGASSGAVIGMVARTSSDSTGCAGHTPIDPISGHVDNNEITIDYASYGCLDYSKSGDWYVVEKSLETYETKSHGLYWYDAEDERVRQQHSATAGPNRYIDWSPDTSGPTVTGCQTRSLSIAPVSGLGYSVSENLCDGSFNPYVCTGASGCNPYAGSRFLCRTALGQGCATNTWTTYGQRALSYLHSPPAASYYTGHSLVVNWINQWTT